MLAHRNGQGPGMAAPEAAARHRTTRTSLVDHDVVPAAGLTTQAKETALAAKAAQSRQEVQLTNFACDDGAGKAFSTLRAELALIGFSLERAPWGGYQIIRWNLQRNEDSLEGVKQFLRRVKP